MTIYITIDMQKILMWIVETNRNVQNKITMNVILMIREHQYICIVVYHTIVFWIASQRSHVRNSKIINNQFEHWRCKFSSLLLISRLMLVLLKSVQKYKFEIKACVKCLSWLVKKWQIYLINSLIKVWLRILLLVCDSHSLHRK